MTLLKKHIKDSKKRKLAPVNVCSHAGALRQYHAELKRSDIFSELSQP